MFAFLAKLLLVARSRLKSRAGLEAENLVLRQQVIVLSRKSRPRVRLRNLDRPILVWLYRFFPSILNAIVIVKPETVIRWHRRGFQAYCRWKSRRCGGRPRIDREIRDLIGRMSKENPLWGAPRIHGELLMFGIEVAHSTVARYMTGRLGPPSQGWKIFLRNHAAGIASIDLFVVRTISFTALWPDHSSSRPEAIGEHWRDEQSDRAMGIPDHPSAPRSPWQNGRVGRLIGSIPRGSLDHFIVFGEAHLRGVLEAYASDYNEVRTHLSLDKDAPDFRRAQKFGLIAARPILGGLHHYQYVRI